MDADVRIAVALEKVAEPLSGMPLLRVAGYWQGAGAPPHSLEVRYDGQTVTAAILAPAQAADVPRGLKRFNFGTQLPVEPAIGEVSAALMHASHEEIIARRPWHQVGLEPIAKPPRFLARILRSFASGEIISPHRWRARFARLADKILEVRQKVRYRLLARRFRPRSVHDAYIENTTITPRLRSAMEAALAGFRLRPTFSILVPVYNVDPRWLKEAIASVQKQIYPHWELCLADDHSTDPALIRYLQRLPGDPRIKLVRRESNGHICQATNSAADLASGEFIALLDHDDVLAADALFAMAERLQTHPDADVLYSDEDKIDSDGRRYDPQFKPDWSPELLLSYNYVNHFTVIRRRLFEAAGRYRPGFEGSQDHDLLLRATELTDRVQHIPRILYHWRSLPSSTAAAAGVKTYVHSAGRKAVAEALLRRGIQAALFVPAFAKRLGLPVLSLDGADNGPSVAILVHGESADAERAIAAIRQNTSYRNYTAHWASNLNAAAASRAEDVLLVLDAGCTPRERRWLSRLIAHLALPGVGAVGGPLVAADGTVQEAGLTLGQRDGIAPAPAFAGLGPDAISYYFYAEVTRNVSALGGRCLMTRRETFECLGGFDSRRYPMREWNVDYCLRLQGLGLRCVTVAGAALEVPGSGFRDSEREPIDWKHESWNLEHTEFPSELLALKRAFGRKADPFHNPNCSERTAWEPLCDSPLSLPAEASRPPVRVLVAAHNLNNPEGAPRYLAEIVLGLRDRGAIAPIVHSPLGGPGAGAYARAGIPVDVRETAFSRRFVDGSWSPREYEAAQQAAARLYREHRPEAVLANTLTMFPLVEAAARAGIPAVWIIHESYSREHLERLFPPFARKRVIQAFGLAARVILASHDTAALFEHLATRGNFRVIHNGLDPRPFDEFIRKTPRQREARKHFIAVGTVCERKGQHALVEAAAILARDRRDFLCSLVGFRDGIPYADYVRQLIARRGLESVVRLVPETDAVWDYYRSASAFVCTSHMEAFSRAVLEAEAFGLPILSTPVCGVGEQVFWNANALAFDFGDAAGLAEQMRRLLDDGALRESMGRESRAAFDLHLNHEEMLDRYGAVILAAARQGPRAAMPYESATDRLRRAA